LRAAQIEHLIKTLQQGALAQGYREDYWTLGRIAHLIWKSFAVRYQPSGVWRLLHRIGWSCQKPQRRSFGGDPHAIARWRRSAWYRIKKVA
jgi:putative transposase